MNIDDTWFNVKTPYYKENFKTVTNELLTTRDRLKSNKTLLFL